MLLSAGTKVTFLFQCQGYGWSITLYLPTQSSQFAAELAKAQTLAGIMNNATNNSTNITYIRLQSASSLRQGLIYPYNPNISGGYTGVQASSCAYMRLYNANNTQTKLIFWRGLFQTSVNNGGQTNPASPWIGLVGKVWAQLVADGWCWLGKAQGLTPPLVNQLPPQPVTGVVLGANNQPTITFAGNVFTQFAANNSVKLPLSLSGLKGCDTLNGQWVVYALTASSCQFTKQVLSNAWLSPSGIGHSQLDALIPIASGLIERYGERKPGRPGYLSRGRSNRKKAIY